jgi:hypothetical protein
MTIHREQGSTKRIVVVWWSQRRERFAPTKPKPLNSMTESLIEWTIKSEGEGVNKVDGRCSRQQPGEVGKVGVRNVKRCL